ncbi:MAG: hypothetical protein GWP06_02345 [Actinobacteria bacterium]|nr:hypothetical protein [Actinomycetota bacterium]
MKYIGTTLLALAMSLAFNSFAHADGKLLRGEKWQPFSVKNARADFYIAPNGHDAWSGTLAAPNAAASDGPFATIERAQKAVRELKKRVYKPKDKPIDNRFIGSPHLFGSGRDILVLIKGGFYQLEKPLTFTPADGGERIETSLPTGAFEYHKLKDQYVTFAAYPGETPIISGGPRLMNWSLRNGVWSTHLSQKNVERLVANGKMQTLARTPNTGFYTPPKISQNAEEFYFNDGEIKQWRNMEDNRVIMLLRWHTGVNSIAKIDKHKHLAYLQKPQPGITVVPPRYYVENVRALLDAPGEWFFNKKTEQLFFIPPKKIANPNNANIVAPRLSQLLIVKGERDHPVRNLRFYGLHFEATAPGNDAILLEYAHACEVIDSEIRSIGGAAVRLSKGCYQNRIMHDTIVSADKGAIAVAGDAHPKDWTDIISENTISFNTIDDCGGSTISASNTLYTTISHNEISNNRGRYSISVGGWSNLEEAIDYGYRVEYNHIHNVQKYADDSGAIKTAGMTHDSYVRYNLIHDVKAGYYNDNVGFWFDNMSSGWTTEYNIYYNLQQGEMKLCAANLVDNLYRDNFIIEPPKIKPEGIIDGEPSFDFADLTIAQSTTNDIRVGHEVTFTAKVYNAGSTGIEKVALNIDGKIVQSRLFPVIHKNNRIIKFTYQFSSPGEHRVAIGTTPYRLITVTGNKVAVLYDSLRLSESIIPVGENISVSAIIKNVQNAKQIMNIPLYLNDQVDKNQIIRLATFESRRIQFSVTPKAGTYSVRIGRSESKQLRVYPHHLLEMQKANLKTFISGTAYPCEFKIDQKGNRYQIRVGGTDFYHAEDSYGAIYIPQVKGNFVATVKVKSFGPKTHEWFRAGIFVRNDISKSFDTGPGSKGSVLVFTTPGRAGLQWDEFASGCMHKATSENLPENTVFPVWLKLIRHGNSFSGYISLDGKNWSIERHTGIVPEISDAIDIGLAAGSDNKVPYQVQFEDFQIDIENAK